MTVAPTLEPVLLRRAFGNFPTGVAALAALVDGRPTGIAVSSFTSVSLEPALVLVCVAHSSTTWPLLSSAERLGISVLSADQQEACRRLSGRDRDRFVGLSWWATESGAVVLHGASAWFECSVGLQCEAGDHDIVLLNVHDLDGDHSVTPLVFHASQFKRLDPVTSTGT
jgi:flavin reductase (DIM6/NTAB) family NADH-FMN oxidoreductase RutF